MIHHPIFSVDRMLFRLVTLTRQGTELPACCPPLHHRAATAGCPEVTGAWRRKGWGQSRPSMSPTPLAAECWRYCCHIWVFFLLLFVCFFVVFVLGVFTLRVVKQTCQPLQFCRIIFTLKHIIYGFTVLK